jgi:hypothetical protein
MLAPGGRFLVAERLVAPGAPSLLGDVAECVQERDGSIHSGVRARSIASS